MKYPQGAGPLNCLSSTVLIMQKGKLRHKEDIWLAQGHRAVTISLGQECAYSLNKKHDALFPDMTYAQ
jgi:hypothetical protein